MRIMIYSQHVLGIGHFFRSMEIASALHSHEVLFVEGGEPVTGFQAPAHVQRVFLPPLMMDAEFKRMEVQGGNVEDIKGRRRQLMMETFQAFAPDILITELFPFGRKQFAFELMPLLERVREGIADTRIVCSLRDILVEKRDQDAYEKRVLATLNPYYHLLLIHSDPALIKLDDTFVRTSQIRIPHAYTGFVVRKCVDEKKPDGVKVIVVSSGGGKVGVDLLASSIRAFKVISSENLRMRVFEGPFMEASHRAHLAELVSSDDRISIHPFTLDFLSELARADLSISMAGYNTCMDILSAGLRALVHPFGQNREQAMRARRLEKLGVVGVIESLAPASLASRILEELQGEQRNKLGSLDIAGAQNTARMLEDLAAK